MRSTKFKECNIGFYFVYWKYFNKLYFKQNFATWFLLQAKTILIHLILHNSYAFRNDMHCGVFLKSAFYGLMRHFCYAFLHSIFADSIGSVSTMLQKFCKKYPQNQTHFFSWNEIKIRKFSLILRRSPRYIVTTE